MEKFNCPKCHVISDVEVTEDTKFFELLKKCAEELKHNNSLPWYKQSRTAFENIPDDADAFDY